MRSRQFRPSLPASSSCPAWPGLPAAASHPAKNVTPGASFPKQSAADGPPAFDRLHVAGLPVGIVSEYGKAGLNVESERGFIPEDESDGVVFGAGGEIHFLQAVMGS